jgi:hypothetical protein
MVAFRAEKIVGITVFSASAASSSTVRLGLGLDFFYALLNHSIMVLVSGQVFFPTGLLTGWLVTVGTGGLFGWYIK